MFLSAPPTSATDWSALFAPATISSVARCIFAETVSNSSPKISTEPGSKNPNVLAAEPKIEPNFSKLSPDAREPFTIPSKDAVACSAVNPARAREMVICETSPTENGVVAPNLCTSALNADILSLVAPEMAWNFTIPSSYSKNASREPLTAPVN